MLLACVLKEKLVHVDKDCSANSRKAIESELVSQGSQLNQAHQNSEGVLGGNSVTGNKCLFPGLLYHTCHSRTCLSMQKNASSSSSVAINGELQFSFWSFYEIK